MSESSEVQRPIAGSELARIGLVAAGAVVVWFRLWEPFPQVSVIGLLATLIGGYPIFREAVENVMERRMTMELSMTIALLAALAIREFFTALVITLFVLVAEVLEGLTVSQGRRAIRELVDLLPRTATVRRHGATEEISTSEIRAGDLVMVKPGERIPVDGLVVGGQSFVVEAAITGESMPAEKTPGARAYAGTINQSGALEISVERLGRDTTFGKIIAAVEEAERSRAPIQKIADRLAGYLVYFAMGTAALTFLLTRNVRSTISVIIVAGACGIAAGTPLAILGAIGRAARQGSIIKGGLYLEILATIDTVLLDKTGTLTYGTPRVREVRPAAGMAAREVLQAASIAERKSEHPLGKAILGFALENSLPVVEPERFEYTPGRGVVANVNGDEIIVGSRALLSERDVVPMPGEGRNGDGASEVFVARNRRFLGSIRIADVVRTEARAAVSALKQMGIQIILVTGDNQEVANSVARELGVEQVMGELLPEAKMQRIRELRLRGRKVAMLGDGINDAPALTEASVGIAMGSGTEVARESADIVLIGDDLSRFVETLRIARHCRRIILQNFVGTLAVDSVGMGLAAFGFLNPLMAAFIHVSSELAFILNSARLLPGGKMARPLPG